jgi:hypothetical protein
LFGETQETLESGREGGVGDLIGTKSQVIELELRNQDLENIIDYMLENQREENFRRKIGGERPRRKCWVWDWMGWWCRNRKKSGLREVSDGSENILLDADIGYRSKFEELEKSLGDMSHQFSSEKHQLETKFETAQKKSQTRFLESLESVK